MSADDDRRFGQLAIQKGWVTPEQVTQCLKIQAALAKQKNISKALGTLMVSKEWITQQQKEELLKDQAKLLNIAGYTLMKKLGSGGMGAVYLARQNSMDRYVALKILPQALSKNDVFIKRFQREAKAAARLNVPQVVQAIDVGESQGTHYFAMEYVAGRTLKQLMEAKGPLNEGYSLHLLKQAAQGLKAAHTQGIVHRDIKPDNLLISQEGATPEHLPELGTEQDVLKIVDMGLAKFESEEKTMITQVGSAMGTPHYMAPEQCLGQEDLDFRADVYSLGATFYHMLTGQTPFQGKNVGQVLTAHVTKALVDPRTHRSDLSESLVSMISRMMAKKAEHRYQSYDDLLNDIAACHQGKAVSAPPVTLAEDTLIESNPALAPAHASGSKRNGMIAGGIALLALIVFVFTSQKTSSESLSEGEGTELSSNASASNLQEKNSEAYQSFVRRFQKIKGDNDQQSLAFADLLKRLEVWGQDVSLSLDLSLEEKERLQDSSSSLEQMIQKRHQDFFKATWQQIESLGQEYSDPLALQGQIQQVLQRVCQGQVALMKAYQNRFETELQAMIQKAVIQTLDQNLDAAKAVLGTSDDALRPFVVADDWSGLPGQDFEVWRQRSMSALVTRHHSQMWVKHLKENVKAHEDWAEALFRQNHMKEAQKSLKNISDGQERSGLFDSNMTSYVTELLRHYLSKSSVIRNFLMDESTDKRLTVDGKSCKVKNLDLETGILITDRQPLPLLAMPWNVLRQLWQPEGLVGQDIKSHLPGLGAVVLLNDPEAFPSFLRAGDATLDQMHQLWKGHASNLQILSDWKQQKHWLPLDGQHQVLHWGDGQMVHTLRRRDVRWPLPKAASSKSLLLCLKSDWSAEQWPHVVLRLHDDRGPVLQLQFNGSEVMAQTGPQSSQRWPCHWHPGEHLVLSLQPDHSSAAWRLTLNDNEMTLKLKPDLQCTAFTLFSKGEAPCEAGPLIWGLDHQNYRDFLSQRAKDFQAKP